MHIHEVVPFSMLLHQATVLAWIESIIFLVLGLLLVVGNGVVVYKTGQAIAAKKQIGTQDGWQGIMSLAILVLGLYWIKLGLCKLIFILVAPQLYVLRLLVGP